MSLLDFGTIMKYFTDETTDEDRRELFQEVALMVLARATSSDTNIRSVEVTAVQQVLKEITGEEISEPDIRIAAKSEAFERQPLEKYLAKVGPKLSRSDRITIVRSLARVIQSDERISTFEIDYVDSTVNALGATPSEIIGLSAAD